MPIQGNKPEKRSHELPTTTISAPKYQKNLTAFICYIKLLSIVTFEKFWSIKISSLLLLKVSGTFQTVFSIKTHLEIFLRELVAFKGFLKVFFFFLSLFSLEMLVYVSEQESVLGVPTVVWVPQHHYHLRTC